MWKNYFDLNLSPVLSHMNNADLSQCVIQTIEPTQLVHDAQLIQSIDLRTVQMSDLRVMTAFCEFDIDHTCIISGFAFWFDCYFPSTSASSNTSPMCLSTSPHVLATHWKQTLVFLPEDIYPLQGDRLPVNIRLEQSADNQRHYNLTIAIDECQQTDELDRVGSTIDDDDDQSTTRKRQRRRSSTTSSDPNVNRMSTRTSENDSSDSDESTSDEHSMPCACERPKCQLIKAIMAKFDEDNEQQ
jgi:hypothetical protein